MTTTNTESSGRSLHVQSGYFLGALIMAGVLFLTSTSALAAVVEYTYDEKGRMVGVYAPSGDAAQYIYDANGNVVEIKRFSAATVSIIEFSPNAGPVGSTVVIQGTGFSTTPSNNAVTFNAVAATVSAATVNRLTVTVPASATTGPIAVTIGASSATSSTNFTVTAGGGTPTIASFSPAGGPAATSVALTGTNFESTAALNDVTFNATFAGVSAATSTTITTAVPSKTASGKIRVRTLGGVATSASDFLVPFGSFSASDLVTTARATVDGAAATYSIATAGKVAMVLFDGVQGQNIGIAISSIAYIPSGGTATVYIRRPDNVELMANTALASNATSIDLPRLPLTGTYTVAIVPAASYKMDGTVTVSADVATTLGAAGSVTATGNSRAGQNGRSTFAGTTAQQSAFYVHGLSAGVQPARIDLISPTGAVIATANSTGASAYIQTTTLPMAGTYQLLVSPTAAGTGTWSVQYGVPDLTVTAFAFGTPTINQNGSFNVPVNATVSNQGTVGAKGGIWYDYVYRSVDTTLDVSDPLFGYQLRASDIAAGTSYAATFSFTTTTTVATGDHNTFFKTDGWDSAGTYSTSTNSLRESDEANNIAAMATLTLPSRPDLTAGTPTIGTITINQNGSYNVPISFLVSNGGGSPAKGLWYDYAYVSSDGTLDTGDAKLGYIQRGADLAAGGSYTASATLVSSTTLPSGTFTLFAKADGYDSGNFYSAHQLVAEQNESNNTSTASITFLSRPDLVITSPSVGTISVNVNGSYNIPVSFTVQNNGQMPAKANWYDYCYLSSDGTLDTSDDYIGFQMRTTELAATSSYNLSFTCVTATTTAPGNYTLFLKTDGYNAGAKYSATSVVGESNDTNNTASIAVTLPNK